jgi:hypothetical protein
MEFLFAPLHFKRLAVERLRPSKAPVIHKKRYHALLKNASIQHPIDQAWVALGEIYCTGDVAAGRSTAVQDAVNAVFERPPAERNMNLPLSYLALTGDAQDRFLDFPGVWDSYFIPIINFQKDIDRVEDFFLRGDNLESVVRGILYFDFTRRPELLPKVLRRCVESVAPGDLKVLCRMAPMEIQAELVMAALRAGRNDVLDLWKTRTLPLPPGFGADDASVDLPTFRALLARGVPLTIWKPASLRRFLWESRGEPAFFRDLLHRVESLDAGGLPLGEWITCWRDLRREENKSLADDVWKSLARRFSPRWNRDSLERNFSGEPAPFLSMVWALLRSTDPSDQDDAEKILAWIGHLGEMKPDVVTPVEAVSVVDFLVEILRDGPSRRARFDFASALTTALLFSDRLSPETVLSITERLQGITEEPLRSELRKALPRLFPEKTPVQRAREDEDKVRRREEEREIVRQQHAERDRERQAAQDEAHRRREEAMRAGVEKLERVKAFQVKQMELQTWFQVEMAKTLADPALEPAARAAKMAEVSGEFQRRQKELADALEKGDA